MVVVVVREGGRENVGREGSGRGEKLEKERVREGYV